MNFVGGVRILQTQTYNLGGLFPYGASEGQVCLSEPIISFGLRVIQMVIHLLSCLD